MSRLASGLAEFDISLPDTRYLWQLCQQAYTAHLKSNKYSKSDCLLRLTITGGNAPWGLQRKHKMQANIFVQTAALLCTQTSKVAHIYSPQWPFPLYKRPAKFTADYAQTLRALHSLSPPPPLLPLICDISYVYSGITANVLLYIQNEWLTPKLEHGVLPGITRQTLLNAGIIRESIIPRPLLLEATSMALINSGVGVQAVASIDGRNLNSNIEIETNKFIALVRCLHRVDSTYIG